MAEVEVNGETFTVSDDVKARFDELREQGIGEQKALALATGAWEDDLVIEPTRAS